MPVPHVLSLCELSNRPKIRGSAERHSCHWHSIVDKVVDKQKLIVREWEGAIVDTEEVNCKMNRECSVAELFCPCRQTVAGNLHSTLAELLFISSFSICS